MADCVAIQQECIVAGRATRAKIVSQYKGDCIVTGRSWALGWGAGCSWHAQGALGRRAWVRGQARGRQAQAGARGAQAAAARGRGARRRASGRRAGRTGEGQARGERQGAAVGAGGRGAHGLGVAGR